MNKTITAKSADNIRNIHKTIEYKQFIELVSSDKQLPEHWELLANALGLHRQTLNQWRKLPEFERARIKGINRRLKAMEESGKDDWRQWEASLRLLGVKEASDQPTINIQIPVFNVMTNESKEQLSKLYEGLDSSND